MATGWISIHRELTKHWVWDEKPFSRGQAWIDLILMANHEDAKVPFDGGLVEVMRGSFLTSEVKLSERWGWSRSKVRLFLNTLESDQMIVKNTTNKRTGLSICNYDVWQDSKTTERQQKNSRKTAERQQKDTNNNVNNSNNENNKDLKDFLSADESPDEPKPKYNPDADPSNSYYKAAQHFREMVLNANPTCKVPSDGTEGMIGWTRTIRLMFEADKRNREHVRETLDFCFKKDAFWMHTCQSPASFRRNYDKIRGKMTGEQKQANGQSSFGRSMDKVLAWVPPDER